MALIDNQGRVFGRFNLIDLLLVALLLALLPGAYAARVLFREPPATLRSISPPAVSQGDDRLLELTGTNFRPFMRVSVGPAQAPRFDFYGATQAFVPVPPGLEAGVYDVVLFDHAREVSRLAGALTITGPARPTYIRLQLSGAFAGLAPEAAGKMVVGSPLDSAENSMIVITKLGAPQPAIARVRISEQSTASVPVANRVDVPATVVMSCPTIVAPDGTMRCGTGGVILAPDVHITVQGPAGRQLFRIDRIESVLPPEPAK